MSLYSEAQLWKWFDWDSCRLKGWNGCPIEGGGTSTRSEHVEREWLGNALSKKRSQSLKRQFPKSLKFDFLSHVCSARQLNRYIITVYMCKVHCIAMPGVEKLKARYYYFPDPIIYNQYIEKITIMIYIILLNISASVPQYVYIGKFIYIIYGTTMNHPLTRFHRSPSPRCARCWRSTSDHHCWHSWGCTSLKRSLAIEVLWRSYVHAPSL